MSAAGALRDLVETVIKTVADALHAKDTEQDGKLADLEQRVAKLEEFTAGDAFARQAKKTTTARPGTASGTAKAGPAK